MINSKIKGSASQVTSYAGLTRVSRRPAALLDARIKSAHDGAPEDAVGSKRLIPSARHAPADSKPNKEVHPVKSSGTVRLKFGSAIALPLLIFFVVTPNSVEAQVRDAPTMIAVFDFELEDNSAGAGIAGDRAADAGYMNAVSAEVRRIVERSGRYRLVDVSGADSAAVRDRSIQTCNGCDAGIASELGAEQSLTGFVRRVSRTEYLVGFQLRDAKSGALIAAQDTGLRMGANYSWSRGASRLIMDRLLSARAKQINPSN